MQLQMFSMGFKSGELGGQFKVFIPRSSLTGMHTFLCTGALSSITIGVSKCSNASSKTDEGVLAESDLCK